jgi:hypothetical protein
MKSILSLVLFSLILTSCAGKLPANSTPEDKNNLLKLNITLAVDDAVDGIAAAHSALWLNDNDTVLVLTSLHIALEVVRNSNDPKLDIVSAVNDIKKNLSASSLIRWNPYLNSLVSVLGAL